MSRRFQFSLKTLLVLVFGAACFFGGIRFEQEMQRLADEAKQAKLMEALEGTTFIQRTVDIDDPDYRSPSAEALELRGFEGMRGRPVQ